MGNSLKKNNEYEQKALAFAEKFGIIKYRVDGYKMIYNVSYSDYLGNPRYTMQHVVDLRNMEEGVRQLRRYYRSGEVNR